MSPENLQDRAETAVEDRHRDDTKDVLDFVVRREAVSVRSRSAGKQVRLKLENLVSTCPDCLVNVDFGGISVVSSGFADEFLGKLFLRMGALRFMAALRLRTVSPEVRSVLDRAILERLQREGPDG